MDYTSITREQLGQGCRISLEITGTDEDLFLRMALDIFETIQANNAKDRRTVLILPVGPVRQYRKLALLVNRFHLSLKNTYIFNMDEYLDAQGNALPVSHPLSFKGAMLREFYDQVREDLNVPADQRFFPDPANVATLWNRMQELGGVDVCFGGIGINGHVAFNEPPEPDMVISDEEFTALPGRVQRISRETRTINSTFSTGGVLEAMPEYCVTLGMREIMSARKIRLYLARDWQKGIVRRVLHGPPSAQSPASLLQSHPDTRIIICEAVAAQPVLS